MSGYVSPEEMKRHRENEWTDGRLREYWRRMGGEFHGPNVETGTMQESELLPMLRYLLVKAELSPP